MHAYVYDASIHMHMHMMHACVVYIHLPPNYAEPGYVGLLKKSPYGTSSAPRSWNTLLHNWLQSNNFEVNLHEACLYSGKHNGENVHILVHVDDAALFGQHNAVQWAKDEICKVFECTVDEMKRYLGMDVEKIGDDWHFSQKTLIDALAQCAGRNDSNSPQRCTPIKFAPHLEKQERTPAERDWAKEQPFRSHLGVTGYIVNGTQPDGSFSYKTHTSFNDCYGEKHWSLLNEFISYLWCTGGDMLKIARSRGEQLRGFCDADWNGTACHCSTTGWIIFHGTNPISWVSRTQKCTARSTGESEYISLPSMPQEVIWLKMLLESLGEQPGVAEICSNDGTPEDPGCVCIW